MIVLALVAALMVETIAGCQGSEPSAAPESVSTTTSSSAPQVAALGATLTITDAAGNFLIRRGGSALVYLGVGRIQLGRTH